MSGNSVVQQESVIHNTSNEKISKVVLVNFNKVDLYVYWSADLKFLKDMFKVVKEKKINNVKLII